MSNIFGYSLPPGCSKLPGEDQEDIVIAYVCANCNAVDIDWSKNKVPQGDELNLYYLLQCPCCQYAFDDHPKHFGKIYHDDFHDAIVDNFPLDEREWTITGINIATRQVEVRFLHQNREIYTAIDVPVCEDSKQLLYSEVKSICQELTRGVELGDLGKIPEQESSPYVQQGIELITNPTSI